MAYTNNNLELNRYSGRTNQQVIQKAVMFAEDGIKWLAGFIGHMVRMFLGK